MYIRWIFKETAKTVLLTVFSVLTRGAGTVGHVYKNKTGTISHTIFNK